MHCVFSTACSLLHILLFFICGIGSIFMLLHSSGHSFQWPRIIPKTLALVTGEFDADDLLESGTEIFGSDEFIYIIFFCFVIFCCHIVLMNVFTGLAVGDVADVMTEAEYVKGLTSKYFFIWGIKLARYQMKLAANCLVRPFMSSPDLSPHRSILEMEIVTNDGYGSLVRIKNIIRKHYIPQSS